jgi:signal transduction histidine kinase
VWFERDAAATNRPYLPLHKWPQPGYEQPVTTVTADKSGPRRLHTYIAVQLAIDRHGGLELTEPLEPLDLLTWRRMQIDLATLAALALTSIAVAYGTGIRWVSRPLKALIGKTERIALGDFHSPLNLIGHDELGELAVAINEMSLRLAEHEAAMQAETAQRIAALEQVRHADRLSTVGRLAAGVAHELGTPLNVIGGRAALIASGKLGAQEVQANAVSIKAEADRITAIVRHLMDFARQRRPQRAIMDLNVLAVQAAKLLQQIATQKNVAIEVMPCRDTVRASIDGAQIQQVLINLLSNAIDALPRGGKICVAVQGDAGSSSDNGKGSSFARIVVSDNGTGIAPHDLEHVFEPFFTTKDIGQGTGLGLSIAYGIIQEHGGRIEVTSELGQGSCFTVYLPSEDLK